MDNNRKRMGQFARQYASAALIIVLTAGSVSLASFAEMGQTESVFGVDAVGERAAVTATPSRARRSLATPSSAALPSMETFAALPSLQDLLEQEADNEDAITPTWFQVALNGSPIVDSNDWGITLTPGEIIRSDAEVKHQLRVTIYPQTYNLGAGDSVTWNMGRIEGLSLDGEFHEELILSGGVNVGDVMLYYTEDGDVFLCTEFNAAVTGYSNITITYWYDCGFVSVNTPTGIVIDLPGYNSPVPAVLVPEDWDENETTEPEESSSQETVPEETTIEETTIEQTTTEESAPEETTAEETAPPETSEPEESSSQETAPAETLPPPTIWPSQGHGSGGDSSSDREETVPVMETTVPETVLESQTEPETELQTEEAQTQGQPAQVSQPEPAEGDAGEPDDTDPDAVLDINISFGAEVTASHGMQSQILPNEILTYRMVLCNDSEEEIRDVRIRDYLPEHTSFVSVGDMGVYGVVNGQQYITWVLESVLPGEQVELTFQVKVFPCTPPDYPIRNRVYWQADDSRSVNNQAIPENQVDFPGLTIG